MDLSKFQEPLKSRQGGAGRAAWDPRLLESLWVYAYSEGISSAREIERLMEWEPGFRWLAGLSTVNHHTLSDFRVEHHQALNELFAQLLGMLEAGGLLSLERVMHDGTKIRAQAGADTFRRGRERRGSAKKLGLREFRVRGNAEGGRGTGLGMPDLQRDAVVPADLAEDARGSVTG